MKLKKPVVKKFKVDSLTKADTNVRTEYPEESLKGLRASIVSLGLLELPKCTPEGDVFAGWGRVKACRAEGIEEMYCIEIVGFDEDTQIIASLSENYHRSRLYEDEVRYAIKRLTERDISVPEIAKKTGISLGTLYNLLSFYRLPDEVQKEIQRVADEEEDKIPVYSISKITEVVEMAPEEQQVEVGKKMVEIATAKSPTGKKVTRPILKEIAEKAKLGRAGPSQLERILAEARKKEYMTITLSIPDDTYIPYFKCSKLRRKTINEVILWAMDESLDKVTKEIQGK